MEKNEQKLKEGDDTLRSELLALRETIKINLGLADEAQSKQFNVNIYKKKRYIRICFLS